MDINNRLKSAFENWRLKCASSSSGSSSSSSSSSTLPTTQVKTVGNSFEIIHEAKDCSFTARTQYELPDGGRFHLILSGNISMHGDIQPGITAMVEDGLGLPDGFLMDINNFLFGDLLSTPYNSTCVENLVSRILFHACILYDKLTIDTSIIKQCSSNNNNNNNNVTSNSISNIKNKQLHQRRRNNYSHSHSSYHQVLSRPICFAGTTGTAGTATGTAAGTAAGTATGTDTGTDTVVGTGTAPTAAGTTGTAVTAVTTTDAHHQSISISSTIATSSVASASASSSASAAAFSSTPAPAPIAAQVNNMISNNLHNNLTVSNAFNGVTASATAAAAAAYAAVHNIINPLSQQQAKEETASLNPISTPAAPSVQPQLQPQNVNLATAAANLQARLDAASKRKRHSSSFDYNEPSFSETRWATTTLMKQISILQSMDTRTDGFMAEPNEDNLYIWNVKLFFDDKDASQIATDLYKLENQDHIRLEFRFPSEYPNVPPIVRVVSPSIRGGHVAPHGGICMELLTTSGWAPVNSIDAVCIQIRTMLLHGNARIDFDRLGSVKNYTFEGALSDMRNIVRIHRWDTGRTSRRKVSKS